MWHGLCWFQWLLGVAGILAGLSLTGTSRADEKRAKDRSKDDGDGKGRVIRVDLGKLPPGLAKAVRKYAEGDRRKGKGYSARSARRAKHKGKKQAGMKPKDRARAAQGKGKQGGAIRLPPGLARKPPDHPGRRAYLRSHAAKHRGGAGGVSPLRSPWKGKHPEERSGKKK
jgi:hypothetical protein